MKVEQDILSQLGSCEGLEAGSENQSPGGPGERSNNTGNRNYHRYTAFQTQELEAAFKIDRHVTEIAKSNLARRLGLSTQQVKFWFQNRRCQEKNNLERHQGVILKQENEKLLEENVALKEIMKNPPCNGCGVPTAYTPNEIDTEAYDLAYENAKLKVKLERLQSLISGRPSSAPTLPFHKPGFGLGHSGINGSLGTGLPACFGYENPPPNASLQVPRGGHVINVRGSDVPQSQLGKLAFSAMRELILLTRVDCPLWFTSPQGIGESLNVVEYKKSYPSVQHYDNRVSEGTRASATVMINASVIMETLMDTTLWTMMFPPYVSRASTIDVIYDGTGGSIDGQFKLMQAEFQVISPLMPVRQAKFVRVCKHLKSDTWVLADVSVDTILEGSINSRKFPSGCVVKSLPNGCSKVTWVEHTEYDENVVDEVFRPFVRSGMTFSAHNWVSYLQRQYEIHYAINNSMPTVGANAVQGRTTIMALAMRMERSFATSICSTLHGWTHIGMHNSTRFMIRDNCPSEEPTCKILSAVNSTWLPILPQHLFEFLQNEDYRMFWDKSAHVMHKLWQNPETIQDPGSNNIRIIRGLKLDSAKNIQFILQDTWKDAFGLYLVSGTMDDASFDRMMRGDVDSGRVAIIPSGFAIMPDSVGPANGEGSSTSQERQFGAFLFTGVQILASGGPLPEDVERVNKLINDTINGIKCGLNIE